MNKTQGSIIGINGNMISVIFEGGVLLSEVAFVISGQQRLMSEVTRIRGNTAYLQVFEDTVGIKINDRVEFSGRMLSVTLGPGILGRIYDGLQNPLVDLAEKHGYFLKRGVFEDALDYNKKWEFIPQVKQGDQEKAGSVLGYVTEGVFRHCIMVPFNLVGEYEIENIVGHGSYTVKDNIGF